MIKPTKPETLYKWAERKFGPSKCTAIRFIRLNPDKPKWLGEYCWDDGVITLNLTWIKSFPTLYRTLAHEWTHAQQMWRDYKWYEARYEYKENPLEKKARKREKRVYPKKA